MNTRSTFAASALTLFAALFFSTTDAYARAGYYGPAVSTWDTRASSVVTGAQMLAADGAVFSAFTYNTNFSSTSGNLSSQFGVHYLNLAGEARVDLLPDDDREPGAVHGVSAGAVTLLGRPLMDRHPGGLPKLAWGAYGGVIPSALIGLDRNYLTVPLVAGAGISWAPLPWLSFTPWGEVALSFNFDSWLDPTAVDTSTLETESEPTVDDVLGVLTEALVVEHGGRVTGRGGLMATSHLGERWDVALSFTLASLQDGADSNLAAGGALRLVFHWDRVVQAVLEPTQ